GCALLIGVEENRVYRLVNCFYFKLRNHGHPFPGEQYNRETPGRSETSLCTCQSWLSRQFGICVTSPSANRPRVSVSSERFWIRNLIFSAVCLSARRVPDLTY